MDKREHFDVTRLEDGRVVILLPDPEQEWIVDINVTLDRFQWADLRDRVNRIFGEV